MNAPLQLVGDHPSIAALRDLIARVAASQARTVLLYGETGTGKSLVARMLHQQSSRAWAEFIDINCAAIPAQLLESELFGHERGAFTGAVGKKEGLIEAGNGGTVFLDEVRELDLVMQSKLLTLLDTRRFRRVGAVKPISVDVRFIAATNKILLSEVNAGKFREDLYYRLQVIAINIPPLRERGDDILLLAHSALHRYNLQYGSRMEQLDPEVERIFRAYPWPGNVRELENLLERICLLEQGDCVLPVHLPARILRAVGVMAAAPADPADAAATVVDVNASLATAATDDGLDYYSATARFQAELIEQTLVACNGNVARAAQRLGLSRHALRHQMIKLGLASN
ncbi:Sigma-54-dependent transcriptional activator (plasmid) [Cupriavidus necator H850]|uniref:sigma-54 interaction domain-containing protein n=1 Tax=Cupriavidus necator TaxID=106590 RepID=UPI00129EB5A9|nr:sigma-54 dependent transcriptional regulator [Cupriavidus necator]KAI3603241.1 Sigma-54-dependent transcriptional activator [Cupriavidus necator H850]